MPSCAFLGDGNCYFWSLLDQITYDPELSTTMRMYTRTVWTMRTYVVKSVDQMIRSGAFSRDFFAHADENDEYDGSVETWKKSMLNTKKIEYADERCYELASLLLKRTIIFYPVMQVGYETITYHPEFLQNGRPFHLLYFSETVFSDGHFQSLRPVETVNDPNIGPTGCLNMLCQTSNHLLGIKNTLLTHKNGICTFM